MALYSGSESTRSKPLTLPSYNSSTCQGSASLRCLLLINNQLFQIAHKVGVEIKIASGRALLEILSCEVEVAARTESLAIMCHLSIACCIDATLAPRIYGAYRSRWRPWMCNQPHRSSAKLQSPTQPLASARQSLQANQGRQHKLS